MKENDKKQVSDLKFLIFVITISLPISIVLNLFIKSVYPNMLGLYFITLPLSLLISTEIYFKILKKGRKYDRKK